MSRKTDVKVAGFPPIPRIPRPPQFPPDPRQHRAQRIIGNIAAATAGKMHLAGANFVEGYPAAGVNLGALQEAMERALRHFKPAHLEPRWEDVFDWVRRVLGRWVQRYKQLKIERFEEGIRIEIETQDDLGYYDYAFDVFPDRDGGARRRRERAARQTAPGNA